MPALWRPKTAAVARFVSTFSCVTNVPSTSAMSILIGPFACPFFDVILNLFLVVPSADKLVIAPGNSTTSRRRQRKWIPSRNQLLPRPESWLFRQRLPVFQVFRAGYLRAAL